MTREQLKRCKPEVSGDHDDHKQPKRDNPVSFGSVPQECLSLVSVGAIHDSVKTAASHPLGHTATLVDRVTTGGGGPGRAYSRTAAQDDSECAATQKPGHLSSGNCPAKEGAQVSCCGHADGLDEHRCRWPGRRVRPVDE